MLSLVPASAMGTAQEETRQRWIHPFLYDRLTHGVFITLCPPKLRDHKDNFFSCFRMSMKSFHDLVGQIWLARITGQASQWKYNVAFKPPSVYAPIQMHVNRPTRFPHGWKVDLNPPGNHGGRKSCAPPLTCIENALLLGETVKCEQGLKPRKATRLSSKTLTST